MMTHDFEGNLALASVQSQQEAEERVSSSKNVGGPALDIQEASEARPGAVEQQILAQKRRWWEKPSTLLWRTVLNLGDGLLIILVCLLAPTVLFALHLTAKALLPLSDPKLTTVLGVLLVLVFWKLVANITQAHDLVQASNRFLSLLAVFFTFLFMFVLWMLLAYPFAGHDYLLCFQLALCFTLIAFPLVGIWRVAFATFVNAPRFRRPAVIVGVNPKAEATAQEVEQVKRSGIRILGYISDTVSGEQLQVEEGQHKLPVIGGAASLHRLAEQGCIDIVILAVDFSSDPRLCQEAMEIAQQGIAVVPVTAIYERTSGKLPVEHIGEQWYPLLPAETTASPLYLVWQKTIDLVFGLVGTLALALILPPLALLIYLDSPGPIFYSQVRLGYQGRAFKIYKFRSMRVNAEQGESAQWASKQDLRVTRVGAFMRATHLDELPQVWNILRGEMSLIGPRPERREFVSSLEKSIPFYRFRLSVKPGLTGWAQVKYHYGNNEHDALVKLQYDLYYIRHRFFVFDIFIMLMTVIEVLFRRGV